MFLRVLIINPKNYYNNHKDIKDIELTCIFSLKP